MTYLDIVYRYGATPGEREMRAIDGVREVYGVQISRRMNQVREKTIITTLVGYFLASGQTE